MGRLVAAEGLRIASDVHEWPESSLRASEGSAFPSYSLMDQDETLRTVSAGTPRPPALYIFYRGDW